MFQPYVRSLLLVSSKTRVFKISNNTSSKLTHQLLIWRTLTTEAAQSVGLVVEQTSLPKIVEDVKTYIVTQLTKKIPNVKIIDRTLDRKLSDSDLEEFDRTNIPYVISLSESVLDKGIILVRKRETTIWEEVHVSRLIHQMESCYRHQLQNSHCIEEKQDSAAKNQSSDKATEYAT